MVMVELTSKFGVRCTYIYIYIYIPIPQIAKIISLITNWTSKLNSHQKLVQDIYVPIPKIAEIS